MDEENFEKLPIEERCVHKSWKARISGYSLAVARFDEITDERSVEWNKYMPIIKTVLEDNNDPALEKGLEVVLNFVLKSAVAVKVVGEIIAALVKRSVASSRARTRDLSAQICLAAVEIGKQKIVTEEILKGTESKNPKISAHCMNILTEIIKAFGTSVLPVDGVLQKLPVLLEDKDQNVRNAAKTLAIEFYQWLGEELRFKLLKPDLLKPQKLAEIVSEIAKIEKRSTVPSRFLRTPQTHQVNTGFIETREVASNDDVNKAEMEVKEQLYKDLEPVEIMSRIPEEFFVQLKSPKWAERKGALENLEKLLAGADRIENADYSGIMKQLIDVISKDANVTVVCLAVKCVTYFAQKLRGNFYNYSPNVFKALLEKLKERKPSVVKTLREAMDAVYEWSTLDKLVDDLLMALGNKNPSVKSEGALFLSRCFSGLSPASLNRGSLKPLFPALVECLSDQDPCVRDRSANALGVASSVVGEKALSPLFKELEAAKLAKVREYAKSIPSESKTLCEIAADALAQTKDLANPKPDSIEQSTNLRAHLDKKNALDASKNKKTRKGNHKSIMPKVKITDLLPEGTMKFFVDRDWSVRMQAISEVQKLVNSLPPDVSVDLGDLGPLLSSRILESNPKISTASINLVTSAAERSGLSREQLRIFLPALFKAVGDVKGQVRDAALGCLNKYGEICGCYDIFKCEVLPDNLRSGSNLTKANLWRWIGDKLRDTSLRDISKSDLESLLPSLFSSLEDKNADVRFEASRTIEGFLKILNLGTVVSRCDQFFGNPNNAVIKIILDKSKSGCEALCEASSKLSGLNKSISVEKLSPIVSCKKVTFVDSIDKLPLLDVNDLKNQRVIDEHKHKTAKWDFVTPRIEFVELLKGLMSAANFSQELLKLLFHSDFRCHIKAMDLLMEEIRRNSTAIICNLDLILRWLTLRFFDGNPTILSKSLDFVITALGNLKETNYCLLDSEALAFVPYLVLKLGDSKENVQSKVKEILGELTSVYPVSKLRKFVLEGARSNIARQRANCLDVLASYIKNYGESVYLKEVGSVSETVGKLLKDRDAAVKKKAFHVAGMLYDREGEKIMKIIENYAGDDFRTIEDRIRKYIVSKPSTVQNQYNAPDEVLYHSEEGGSLSDSTSLSFPLENTELQPISDPCCDIFNGSKSLTTGKFCWDEQLVQEVDDLSNLTVQPARIVDIDLGFLKEEHKTLGTFQRPQTLHSSNVSPFLRYIEDVANDDLANSKTSMTYIDMMINSGRGDAFLNCTDLLLRKIIQNLEKLGKRCCSNEVLENYGSVFTLLITLCTTERRFIERFSEERLYAVIEQLLVMLSGYKFNEADHDVYKKTVNVIILKILEGSAKTPLLCALLRLLSDTRKTRATNVSGRLNELSMKCLWKFIRNQPSYDDELDYRVVFSAIREFLKPFSRPWWKSAIEDPSLRTVKTLLREMVKLRGKRVFQDVGADDCELERYFSRRLKSMSLKRPVKPQSDATQ